MGRSRFFWIPRHCLSRSTGPALKLQVIKLAITCRQYAPMLILVSGTACAQQVNAVVVESGSRAPVLDQAYTITATATVSACTARCHTASARTVGPFLVACLAPTGRLGSMHGILNLQSQHVAPGVHCVLLPYMYTYILSPCCAELQRPGVQKAEFLSNLNC